MKHENNKTIQNNPHIIWENKLDQAPKTWEHYQKWGWW